MNQERAEPLIPISESWEMRISWQIVSNAELRSRRIKMFVNPASIERRILLTTRLRVISVLLDGQNPD